MERLLKTFKFRVSRSKNDLTTGSKESDNRRTKVPVSELCISDMPESKSCNMLSNGVEVAQFEPYTLNSVSEENISYVQRQKSVQLRDKKKKTNSLIESFRKKFKRLSKTPDSGNIVDNHVEEQKDKPTETNYVISVEDDKDKTPLSFENLDVSLRPVTVVPVLFYSTPASADLISPHNGVDRLTDSPQGNTEIIANDVLEASSNLLMQNVDASSPENSISKQFGAIALLHNDSTTEPNCELSTKLHLEQSTAERHSDLSVEQHLRPAEQSMQLYAEPIIEPSACSYTEPSVGQCTQLYAEPFPDLFNPMAVSHRPDRNAAAVRSQTKTTEVFYPEPRFRPRTLLPYDTCHASQDESAASTECTSVIHSACDETRSTSQTYIYHLESERLLNGKWSLMHELTKLSRYGWYWGPVTKEEAEEKLNDQPEGSFLIRDSTDECYLFSLSFRSFNRTFHTRIEYFNGKFSFYHLPHSKGYRSLVDLVESATKQSFTGLFYHSHVVPGSQSYAVKLTKPVSRFAQVRSLQYLCRFIIRQHTRVDHIQNLPLPTSVQSWLGENQY